MAKINRKSIINVKKIKLGLLPRIVIAIALGIVFGNIFSEGVVRVFLTFNGIFSQFLGFLIPLIIVGLVTPAIADIGKGAGKMLLATTLLAYGATLLSGFFSYGVSELTFPSMINEGASSTALTTTHELKPFFTVEIPAVMNVMTALVMSFTLGLGIASIKSTAMKNVFSDLMQIITKTIQVVIIPLLPLYIFGIFLNMTYA